MTTVLFDCTIWAWIGSVAKTSKSTKFKLLNGSTKLFLFTKFVPNLIFATEPGIPAGRRHRRDSQNVKNRPSYQSLAGLARNRRLLHNVGRYSQVPTIRNNATDSRRKSSEIHHQAGYRTPAGYCVPRMGTLVSAAPRIERANQANRAGTLHCSGCCHH